MPETTPMPKEMAKILVQNSDRLRKSAFPVASHRASSTAIQQASPTVKEGNRM